MVPSGTVLTYQARISVGGWSSADDIQAAVAAFLAQQNIAVRDYHTTTDSLVSKAGAGSGLVPYTYQSTMTLQTRADFGQIADIQSIVDHAFYLQVDQLPGSSTIPNVSYPSGYDKDGNPVSSGVSTSTGQPGVTQDNSSGGGGGNPATDLASFFSNLFGSVENSVTFLFVGIILAVVLIIAGKHKGVLNV